MLYEVTLRQEYYGQACLNRWTYVSGGTPAAVSGSFALVKAMGFILNTVPPIVTPNTIFDTLGQIQKDAVTYREVEARAIYDPLDFYVTPFPSGTVGRVTASEGLSPVAAYGFRTNRVRQDVRRATKRFVGVVESWSGPGGVLVQDVINMMNTLAAQMSAVLTYDDEGNTISFSPCVASKFEYTTPKGNKAYKYSPDPAEQAARTATGIQWQPYPTVRSQTSRQYGRGI